MTRTVDYTGRRFGMLVVLGRGDVPRTVMVRCDCGKETRSWIQNLSKGQKSCGCRKFNPREKPQAWPMPPCALEEAWK